MTPIAARNIGIDSVDISDPNATGNAVHAITRMKISQTWLASQTGLIERWMSPRTRAPLWAEPAVRSQKPAPKSALPKIAYAVTPSSIRPRHSSGSISRPSPSLVRRP